MKKSLVYHNVFLIFLVFFSTGNILAQLGFCQGNSGDSIFTETFGTGTTNTTLPAGTTTYSYFNGIPNDGFYSVMNTTSGNTFGWHAIQDHTAGDINGKMLVVNASFSAGEFYRTIVSGLCENTTYEFSAWMMNLVIAGGFCSTLSSGTIPINVGFEIWDNTDTNRLASGNTGDIFETNSPNWEQYALVFQTLPAQTSVILKMINNGIGGCGNDLAIDDIVFKSCGDFIGITDSSGDNAAALCSVDIPYNTIFTATPDNTVFSSHFYQWQESVDGITWGDIIGETNATLTVSGVTSTIYYRAKVAEYATNLNNADCITFSDVFSVIITQAGPQPPNITCWDDYQLDTASCTWQNNGSQDTQPPIVNCWDDYQFDTTTCTWQNIGVQDAQLPNITCWDNYQFDTASCTWQNNGSQDIQPPIVNCWDDFQFDTTTCTWQNIGTQDIQPSNVNCWDAFQFDTTSCTWQNIGVQDAQPPNVNCWDDYQFDTASCAWQNNGMQDVQPPIINCWDDYQFDTTTCTWQNIGFQDVQPPNVTCWDDFQFNPITCEWENRGIEPMTESNESYSFCEGEDITLFANTTLINPDFDWDSGEISQSITISNPGNYSVEISDSCTTEIINFQVTQIDKPIIESVISVGNDIVVETTNMGDFLYALDGVQYQSSNTFYNVENGLNTVYVKDVRGCNPVIITHFHFAIPTFFTPNNDGYNDTFNLNGMENYNTSEVYVFDRFGKLIKSAKNSPFVWDGTFNNQELPNADYWYIVILDNQEMKGHFTLKR
ncbi:T9SS type B sorting domain-containing protein [Lacinutrix cladophorae]